MEKKSYLSNNKERRFLLTLCLVVLLLIGLVKPSGVSFGGLYWFLPIFSALCLGWLSVDYFNEWKDAKRKSLEEAKIRLEDYDLLEAVTRERTIPYDLEELTKEAMKRRNDDLKAEVEGRFGVGARWQEDPFRPEVVVAKAPEPLLKKEKKKPNKKRSKTKVKKVK